MTDEELAEQYVKENGKVYYHSNGEPMFTREEDLKFAFLAGLKAGRPKWHKVADGDLPSEEGGWAWVCNQDGLPCFFNWGTYQWLDCEGTQIRTTEWCYMPHKE